MAKSRRKAGGATSGRYKPKKMGKGWSSYRDKLGFRPPPSPVDETKTDAPAKPAKPAKDEE
jgi:hypothetical protein